MRMVIGLGNPGKKHEADRHNVGFMVLDRLAKQLQVTSWKTQCEALVARVMVAGESNLLVKPQTYMNLSGVAVAALLGFYKVPHVHCLVISDDLDLPVAVLRQRNQGTAGGHKGLHSIIQKSGGSQFKRLRIGIGRPVHKSAVNAFVLGFFGDESATIEWAISRAAQRAEYFLQGQPFENESVQPCTHQQTGMKAT